ncbi:MAG: glycosyl hydrolase family 28 protein [Ignavibacteriaceae bacterium]
MNNRNKIIRHFDQREKSQRFLPRKLVRNDKIAIVFFLVCLFCFQNAFAKDFIFNVTDYGAKGDGLTLDTKAIQSAIDDAAVKGGKVILPGGKYLSGTLFMKSNVTIEISEGATLLGSTNIKDYPDTIPSLQSYNDAFLTQSLIYGDNLENISITGRGTIDGQGSAFKVTTRVKPDRYRNRPFVIRFIECKNILIENISMKNSAMWMQQYLACEFLTVRGINVYNHANQNNDMIDIDGCKNVIISDCFGDTDDDALTFKSTSGKINENITVTNCVLSSHVNAIKFGTETIGGFKNVAISNIVVKPSSSKDKIYGLINGIGGIVLAIVDGGTMDGITISNIRIDGAQTPIFLRLGNRGRTIRENMPKPDVGIVRNINISNVTATNVSNIGSSITGIPNHYIENISLNNINISYSGGGTKEDAEKIPPENEKEYPESDMFGTLPAYGFYIRHAKNISLNNIQLSYEEKDRRPALYCNDIEDLNISGLKAKADLNAESVIVFDDVKNAEINFSKSLNETKQFIKLSGNNNSNIKLIGNDFSNVKDVHNASEGIIKYEGNLK